MGGRDLLVVLLLKSEHEYIFHRTTPERCFSVLIRPKQDAY